MSLSISSLSFLAHGIQGKIMSNGLNYIIVYKVYIYSLDLIPQGPSEIKIALSYHQSNIQPLLHIMLVLN